MVNLTISTAILAQTHTAVSPSAQQKNKKNNVISPSATKSLRMQHAEALKLKADQAYNKSNYPKALHYLKEAYKVSKDARYVANQGIVLTDMKQYKAAIEAFEFFIASNPILSKKRSALQKINELRPEVKIISNPDQAEVFIKGQKQSLGTTPVKLRLIAGQYDIMIRKSGYDSLQTQLFVISGTPTLAQYKLLVNGASLTNEYTKPNHRSKSLHTGIKALLFLSSLGLITSGTSWFLTRDAVIERNESLQRANWNSAQDNANFYDSMTWTSFSFSMSSLVAAGIWWYLDQKPATRFQSNMSTSVQSLQLTTP
jgi:tetratricopeptide (TPR) repeat protein